MKPVGELPVSKESHPLNSKYSESDVAERFSRLKANAELWSTLDNALNNVGLDEKNIVNCVGLLTEEQRTKLVGLISDLRMHVGNNTDSDKARSQIAKEIAEILNS